MKQWMMLGLTTAVLLTGPVASSEAAMITYSSLASWSAAVGPHQIETFDGFRADTSFQGVSVPLSGGMSVTGTTGNNGGLTQMIDAPPGSFSNFYNLNGTPAVIGDLAGPNQFTRFDFSTPMTAWSMETKGIADGGRPTMLKVYDSGNTLLGAIALASDGSNAQIQFYGWELTSGTAAYVTLTNASGNNDVFGLENVRFVSAPEPATLALLGLGFVGVARRFRRR